MPYKDTHRATKQQIVDALSAINVPVFNKFVPPTFDGDAYILISSISDSDDSTFTSTDINKRVTLIVSTKKQKANSNLDVDTIAGEVMTAVDAYEWDFSAINVKTLGARIVSNDDGGGELDVLNIYAQRTITFELYLYNL